MAQFQLAVQHLQSALSCTDFAEGSKVMLCIWIESTLHSNKVSKQYHRDRNRLGLRLIFPVVQYVEQEKYCMCCTTDEQYGIAWKLFRVHKNRNQWELAYHWQAFVTNGYCRFPWRLMCKLLMQLKSINSTDQFVTAVFVLYFGSLCRNCSVVFLFITTVHTWILIRITVCVFLYCINCVDTMQPGCTYNNMCRIYILVSQNLI